MSNNLEMGNGAISAADRSQDMQLYPAEDNSAESDLLLRRIIYFYCIYIGIIFVGGIAGYHTNFVGAALFLILLYFTYWRHIFQLKISFLVVSIFFSMLFAVIPTFSFDLKILARVSQELIKYYALHSVILIGLSIPLEPPNRSKRAPLLYCVLLFFLLAGWWLQPVSQVIDSNRIQGFLPNPNGFALTAITLLFLMDERHSSFLLRLGNHLMVFTLIYISQTSGAIFGYFIGICHRFIFQKKPRSLRFMIVLALVSVTLLTFLVIPSLTFRPLDLMVKKINLVKEKMDLVFSGQKIDYYSIIEKEGEDITSGLWRLSLWYRILKRFWNSSLDKVLFGYGIGTTDIIFKTKSHNDYLRLLFEAGIVGFFLNFGIWFTLYRRMDISDRWVALMIAVFCFTENNYDHFPAMSMLAFHMTGSQRKAV